jgi:2-pyrone-4,6-dicarboxylate lactonase
MSTERPDVRDEIEPEISSVLIVGYGEVGRIFAEDLRRIGIAVHATDIAISDSMRTHASDHTVTLVDPNDLGSVVSSADVIVSAVTASQAVTVARQLASLIAPGTMFLDVNSTSPGATEEAAALIGGAGGRYVEAAMMTSVPPYRTKVPMLIGGPSASAAAPSLHTLGLQPEVVSAEFGVASATKMSRSIMIKGLEAMVIESFTTARHYGVEESLLTSLQETFPGIDWETQASYFFQRVSQHGRRRAQEMHEAARTVSEAGLHPWVSAATAARQDWVADLVADGHVEPLNKSTPWRERADQIRRAQPVTTGWLAPYGQPSQPVFALPPGAIDAHCHVFGPGRRFPYAPQRKYTPVDAGYDQLFALRDHLGFHGNVIVQATCHGNDNRALIDALHRSDGRARGVVSVDTSVTDAELAAMHAAGVRGVRFNFVKRLVDVTPIPVLQSIAARIAPLGWHIVVYFEAADLADLAPFFAALPTTVVVDHMGRPDVTREAAGPEFAEFLRFLDHNPHVWSKVTCPERLSVSGPPALDGEPNPYRDVVPFCRAVVERFGDRVLWGTDWPHPNLTNHMPDDGLLVDFIPQIAPTKQQQELLLVHNPRRLYWND